MIEQPTPKNNSPMFVDWLTDPPYLVDESEIEQSDLQDEIGEYIERYASTGRGLVFTVDEAGAHGEHVQREVHDDGLLVGGMSRFALNNEDHDFPMDIVRRFTFERTTDDKNIEIINVRIHSADWANDGEELVVAVEWDGGTE